MSAQYLAADAVVNTHTEYALITFISNSPGFLMFGYQNLKNTTLKELMTDYASVALFQTRLHFFGDYQSETKTTVLLHQPYLSTA